MNNLIDEIFENDNLFIHFFETLESKLRHIDDDKLNEMIETLSYWNKEEDFTKMDKLSILYRYKQLL